MKITKAQLRKIIAEEIQETRMGGLGGMLPGESPGFNPERVAGSLPMDVPAPQGSVEDRLDSLEGQFDGMAADLQWVRNKLSTPEGPLDEEEKKKWAQKAADDIEKKGTEGEFTKYCGGDVTQACVDKAAKGSSTKRKRQAAFAANVNSHDNLTYPKGKAKKKKK